MLVSEARKIVSDCLSLAQREFDLLGEEGKKVVSVNQFGDTSLLVDVQIERVIIEYFRKTAAPVRIYSEEHGVVEVGKNPQNLVVLDGMDGTNRYLVDEPCGTMIGIFEGIEPYYDDYLASGIVIQKNAFPLTAFCGEGAYWYSAKFSSGSRSGTIKFFTDLHRETNRLLADKLIKAGMKMEDPRAMALYVSGFVQGYANVILICTRKQNLEIAAACGLITEAGGVIRTLDGRNLLDEKYLKFGQGQEEIPIVVAQDEELMDQILEIFNS